MLWSYSIVFIPAVIVRHRCISILAIYKLSNSVSYLLADVMIFVYEVPFIFWHYINVDEVSQESLSKNYYKVR